MAGIQLEFSIEGEKQLSRRLRHAVNALSDLKEPFNDSGKKLVNIYRNDVFRTRGAVIKEKWKPLSPVTLARKARRGYPSDPLIATHKMRLNFLHRAHSDHLIIKNLSPYFKYHQSNRARRSRLPRRVMLKLAENQKQLVVRTFNEHLRKQLKKS